jgi:dipeptidyl aminopeptidase/acylaminoacyl peptidase
MTEAPYGSWTSPITADLIVSASVGIAAPTVDGDVLYWEEARPTEGGRHVIVRREADGSVRDLNPAPFNARTRVHEYGGGDYAVHGQDVYFSNFADQKLYCASPGSEPVALTKVDGHRYADAVVDEPRNRLICVREDHTGDGEAVNTIVAVDLATGDETVLAEGHDFYAYPRLSPDGTQLAYTCWDHPNMPWDGCELRVARLGDSGRPSGERRVAGGTTESVFQPAWSPDGTLYFVSDRSGWWNLYRLNDDAVEAVAPMQAEFGQPLWQFGMVTYAFDGPGRIVCTYNVQGVWRLATIDVASGTLKDVDTPYTGFRDLRVEDGKAVCIASAPDRPSALVRIDLDSGGMETLKLTSTLEIGEGYISVPETVEFPTEGGLTAFGFYYPPQNQDFEASAGEKPPLLVMSHGGPTAATGAALSARVQYWTSRGIAVLDVNYGGSTGYGRAYRERLNGRWGIVDVDDCVNGARFLVQRGSVDGNRLAITGGSAGGYTTLCALTFHDVFGAGASHYGVSDLEALARDTHKFESRYLDGMVGPYPERRDLYVERSPIAHVDQLNTPVVFFQGLEDQIVPPNQAETMVEALRAKGVPVAYLPFEGEQHGFRRSENIKRSLEGELYFYGRVFGFEPAGGIPAIEIENL